MERQVLQERQGWRILFEQIVSESNVLDFAGSLIDAEQTDISHDFFNGKHLGVSIPAENLQGLINHLDCRFSHIAFAY